MTTIPVERVNQISRNLLVNLLAKQNSIPTALVFEDEKQLQEAAQEGGASPEEMKLFIKEIVPHILKKKYGYKVTIEWP